MKALVLLGSIVVAIVRVRYLYTTGRSTGRRKDNP